MNTIQNNIQGFLSENKIATVCFVDSEGKPYCINCFYVFDEKNKFLAFKSTRGTAHDAFIKAGANIAGTILPSSVNLLSLKGIQFAGKLLDVKKIEECNLSSKYTKRYPASLAFSGYIWALELKFLKLTDNSSGFGNKTIWNADAPVKTM